MTKHIHKRFTDEQVKDLMKRYEAGEISRANIETILGISQTRFFALVKSYKDNPGAFSIHYHRRSATRRISAKAEKRISQEEIFSRRVQ